MVLALALALLACSSEPPPAPPSGPFGLVFATEAGVLRADRDGKNAVAMTLGAGDALPVPSPDGARAVVERAAEPGDCVLANHVALWLVGDVEQKLLTNAAVRGSARWSPDGSTILWASAKGDRDSCGQPYATREDLYAANADGSGERQLAPSKKPVTDRDAAWSPDGTRLAFVRSGELYVLTIGSDAPMRLTDSERRATMASPIWSPDGAEIVFAVLRDDPKKSEIWRIPSAGGKYERLHDGGAFDLPAAWSWDGKTILLESTLWSGETADAAVVALDVASGNRTVLAPDPAEDRDPTLSPDGRDVAFASNRGGAWALWRVGLDGALPIRVTNGSGVGSRAIWVRSHTR